MGKKASAPPPIDYAALAKQQGAENRAAAFESAKLSNPNVYGPLGSQTVSWENGVPTIRQTLSPAQQRLLESQQGVEQALADLGGNVAGQVSSRISQPFQYQGPGIQTSLDLSNAARMPINAGTTAQEAIMRRLEPQLQQRRESVRQNLANQGITPGSEAWQNAMAEQQQGESDLYSQAALQGINADMAARQQAVNEAIQSGTFANTADAANFARQLGLYNLPLSTLQSIMGGVNVNMPQFQGYQGAGVQATPLFQAGQMASQEAMNRYNMEQSANNATTGAIGSMAGAGMMALAL